MKFTLEQTPERIEAIRALGSRDKVTSENAQSAFAAFIGPVVQEVLLQAGTANQIYSSQRFDEDSDPSIPVDLYYGVDAGYITVWSQTWGGGLPTNFVGGMREIKVSTYTLDTAVSLYKKYARKARLDVIAKLIERAANEVLLKQERNAWAVLLMALAEGSTQGTKHVIRAGTAGVFQIDDLNKMFTLSRRINAAYTGGTPESFNSKGLTDIFVSPEIKEQVRGFAYQPMNTRIGPTVAGSTLANYTASNAIPLPDAVRTEIFRNAGASEIYGVTIHEMLELGKSKAYNTLFDTFAGSISYTKADGTGGAVFDGANEQIVVGIDSGRDFAIQMLAQGADNGQVLRWEVDDQHTIRSDKFGWFAGIEEGRVILDSRPLTGLIV